MTNRLSHIAAFGVLAYFASANATTISVDIDADTTDLTVTNVTSPIGADPTITTDFLDPTIGTLTNDESVTVDLFSLTIESSSWLSIGSFDIEATIDFLSPDLDTTFGDTSSFYIVAGSFVDGIITWSPDLVEYVLDDSIFQVDLLDVTLADDSLDNTILISATLSNIGTVSVPEPSTLALLGIGILGLGFSQRRRS